MGDELTQLTVLAANNTGYQNLTLLISRAYQRGYGIAGPIIDRDWLLELGEGLILLSGGRRGDVGRSLLRGNNALVAQCLSFYQQHFPNRYYLELTRTGRPDEEAYLHAAVELAIAESVPVVATNEVCFLNEEDFDAHEIRVAIHDGYTLDDPKRPRNYSPQQYMRSEEEMCELFSDIPEALENSVEIAKRCNVTVRLGEYFLPQFPTGDMSTEDFLVMKSREGLEERRRFSSRMSRCVPNAGRSMTSVSTLSSTSLTRWASRLLPDRDGVYPVVEGQRHSGRAGAWFRRRFAGGLRAENYRSRSAGV